ncbi:MAG: hypothetical protein JO185_08455 [Acidobacteriaceae bacterium]|nr:hypothetical protein [Acidobacteriaceae bacterium]
MLLCVVARAGAQSKGGALSCATCHPQQAVPQPETSMARALGGVNKSLQARPKLTFHKGLYTYTVETTGKQSIYSVTDGTNTISAPIQWAFGAGTQTWVLELNSRMYESFVSYYEPIHALDITMGDQDLQPKTLLEAFGREITSHESAACFGCHSTGAVTEGTLHLSSMEPGVTCEHCHVGAREHQQAVSHGKLQSVPPKLKRLSSEELSNFCGQCHRSFETVVEMRLLGPVNVRFQPYRLANSKCFDGSDARISCIACHDPHREVVRETAAYDSKCLACHASDATPRVRLTASFHQPATVPKAKACPVAKSDCASCHMPTTTLPGSHMIFHDHHIRIVRPHEPYPN